LSPFSDRMNFWHEIHILKGKPTNLFQMNHFHEPVESLSSDTKDLTRALHSLKEEIEAVDWYNQRLENASNDQLRNILKHNRDEEIEHACMIIEWLRRNMKGWDEHLEKYLFTRNAITKIETK